ncbi:MAG: hypothetical protein ACREX8_01975, partial [Gammaproteobacteria bacterium]
ARQTWTFETLAEADRSTLEEVLRGGTAPDPEQLNGWSYRGWNHEPVAKLSGQKFKKGFLKRDGENFGYNEVVRQDKQGYRGEWELKLKDGRPRRIGYFRVVLLKDESPRKFTQRYRHLALFNYNVAVNTGLNYPLRVIRDVVALPNPGDHTLVLGKAYLQLGFPWLTIFYSYFVLGHREQLANPPW